MKGFPDKLFGLVSEDPLDIRRDTQDFELIVIREHDVVREREMEAVPFLTAEEVLDIVSQP